MADWQAECLRIAIADMDQAAVDHFAARLKGVEERLRERKAA
jgi:hypothetical protein